MTLQRRSLPSLLAPFLVAALPVAARAQVAVAWSQFERGVAIAVDRSDHVYTLDYEQQLGAEVVVTKRDAQGSLLWTASFDQTDATKWERAQWLATDSDGAVIVCATLMSGYSNPVVAASIVMKFDASGNFLWRRVGGNGFDGSRTVRCVVDRDDNAYVLGLGQSGTGLVSKVEKFSPTGVSLWSWFDTAGIGAPTMVKLTPDDQLLVTGRSITGSFNGHARIDRDGNTVWSLAGVQSLTVGDAAGDAFGNTFVVHAQSGVANPGTIVKKLGPTGALLWQNAYPAAGMRVEVGPDDAAIVAGFPNQGSAGAAFIKVDGGGALVWSNLDADGPLMLLMHAQLLVDASGDAYLAAGTLFDMAVCKVDANGASQWTATTPGASASAIVFSRASNGVFVVGGRTAHLVDATEGNWQELDGALAGTNGTPRLVGQGRCAQGQPMTLYGSHAAPNAVVVHVVGLSAVGAPLFGGLLVPSPDLLHVAFTDAVGRSGFGLTIPTAVGPGQSLWFQSWCLDAGAIQGLSASNAQRVRGG
jgi:hypothetical protein